MTSVLDSSPGQTPDGKPIRGAERVRVVCAKCSRIIGKVHESSWGVWLNTIDRPGANWADYRREQGLAERVRAPDIAAMSRLHGPDYPARSAWCSRCHAERTIDMGPTFGKLAEARSSRKVLRLPV